MIFIFDPLLLCGICNGERESVDREKQDAFSLLFQFDQWITKTSPSTSYTGAPN